MTEGRDSVFAIVRRMDGRILGARLADDDETSPWSLPAGPVLSAGVRASVAHWCQEVLDVAVTPGQLLAVRFHDADRTVFAFEAMLDYPRPEEFTAHGGAVLGRFFDPEDLDERLSDFERGVLAASRRALESASVVEWTSHGEFVLSRVPPWKRMMPTLPAPFGPHPIAEPVRANRNRASKRR